MTTQRFIFCSLGVLLSLSVGAQSLKVAPAEVQLGEVAFKSKNRVSLTLVNTLDGPLVVRDIRTDCTCTKASWSKVPLMPGDTLRVSVTFTPTDRGAFYKTLRFETVPQTEKPLQAVLRGKVY